MLGNRSVFDTPFSTSSYTAQLILDTQARSLADVLSNDAAVRQTTSRYAESEAFYVRGFQVNAGNVLFNGLPGLIDERQPAIEGVERVELFKGPSGLINNSASDNAVGGSINFIPKRADDNALTRVTVGYASDGESEAHLDVGRRFGTDGAFGIRANIAGRYGDTPIDNQRETRGVGTFALDYRSDRLRLGVNVSHQDRTLLANLSQFYVAPGFEIPQAPDSKTNVFDRSSYFRKRTTVGVASMEYDLTDHVTAFATYGHQKSFERYRGPYSPTITDAAGDAFAFVIPFAIDRDTDSARAGLRAEFNTGVFKHQVTVSADGYWNHYLGGFNFQDFLTTNIYNPVPLAPNVPFYPDPANNYDQSDRRLGATVADVVSAWDGLFTLIAGIRQQNIKSVSRDSATDAVVTSYDKSKLTPAVALLFKPAPRLTLYGNYVQQLLTGPTAPIGTTNANLVFPPIVAKQFEGGVKYNFSRGGVTLALFQITQPVGISSLASGGALPTFSVNGEQRNRGIELNAFGEIVKGVRLLGGVSLLDGRQTKTSDLDGDGLGDDDGRRAPGVPKAQINLGAEWDVGLTGLTVTGRVIYTSRENVDPNSDRTIPSWSRLDLGARYAFMIEGKPLVARLNVENVANKNYWASASGYGLSTSAPRTVIVSLSADF